MAKDAHVPVVLWAERSDRIFVTVEVTDSKDPAVNITDEGVLTVSTTGGSEGVHYELKLELLHPVNSKESKVAVTPRSICLVVMKASPGPYWGKLLKAAGKPPHYVRVDWSKYKDEDEEAEGADPMAGFDMSQLENFKNFGGQEGGDDEGDDDDDDSDDDLPELATA